MLNIEIKDKAVCLFCKINVKKIYLSLCMLSFFIVINAGQNAAPSSHFVFDDNFDGDILINEVRVPSAGVAMYTYYETLGWRGGASGYAGIQAHPRGNNFIFSIWDHKDHKAPIRAVHRGPGTLTEKFGGEGTGLKSWNFGLGWEPDVWYTLISRSWALGDHTFYGFWARSEKTELWTHLVTMDVASKDAFFKGGTDAFIEDWLETGDNIRTTNLRGGWKRKLNGQWYPFKEGRYSVNYWDLEPGKRSFNYKANWNGGVGKDSKGSFYFMTSGGKTTKPSVNNPSQHVIRRFETKPSYDPIRLTKADVQLDKGKLNITWSIDNKALPMFEYKLRVLKSENGEDSKELQSYSEVNPHSRSAMITLDKSLLNKSFTVEILCLDILGNRTKRFVEVHH